jgi:hypothetical protein
MAVLCFGIHAQPSLGFAAGDSNFVLNHATAHTANRWAQAHFFTLDTFIEMFIFTY